MFSVYFYYNIVHGSVFNILLSFIMNTNSVVYDFENKFGTRRVNGPDIKLGGPIQIVQIDESVFTH